MKKKILRKKVDVVVGALYGDEGKGKIISYLLKKRNYGYIFRVNASTNASHTVELDDGTKVVTKQLPSVFFNNHIKLVVGNGAILNLKRLREEIDERPDLTYIYGNVYIASSIPLIIPAYISANKSSDIAKRRGSTNQGTGIALVARTARNCIYLYDIENYMSDIITSNEMVEKLKNTCIQANKSFEDVPTEYYIDMLQDMVSDYIYICEKIGDFSIDFPSFIENIDDDKDILIEGCNGILLDNIHGVNPYTTSASTSISALLNGANLSPQLLRDSYVVCGAYTVCLNKRPMPTEMDEEEMGIICKRNSEIDNAENMQRRIAWLDLPALRRSLVGHEGCKIVLTKLDILQDFEEVKVCIGYDINGKIFDIMPENTKLIESSKPIYATLHGWGNINNIKSYNNVPEQLKDYVRFIESKLDDKYPISILGIGTKTSDIVEVEEKIAVITGCNRGTGEGIMKELLKDGYHVYGINKTPYDKSVAGYTEINCDISDYKKLEIAVHELPSKIDILIHNAGIRRFGGIEELSSEDYMSSIMVNQNIPYLLTKYCYKALKVAQGQVVFIGSHAGRYPFAKGAAYCSSKSGLEGLAEVLMEELRHEGIKVIHLSLGAIKNRDHGEYEEWKLTPKEIGQTIISITNLSKNVLISDANVRPVKPKELPFDGIELLQYK